MDDFLDEIISERLEEDPGHLADLERAMLALGRVWSRPIIVSAAAYARLLERMSNPPAPTPAMLALFSPRKRT